jgi:hypothetical protein
MSDLYATDILVWSEDQAALRRRLADATMYGEPRPALPEECPWTLDGLLGSEGERP